jgi:hypothetical protein
MTSILPIRNIKARTRALVPLQKPVFDRQNKTHRAGSWTDAFGEVAFLTRPRVFSTPAAFGGGDEADLTDLTNLGLHNSEAPE